MRKTVGIIGFGNFGRFMVQHLKNHFDVRISSRSHPKDPLEMVLASDIIIPALPVNILEDFLKSNAALFKPGSLVIDVSSVKIKPMALFNKYLTKNRLLGTHPLFGPESGKNGINGLTVVICPEFSNKSDRFKVTSFLKNKLKLKIVTMSADEHDKRMAQVQALTHFIARGLQRIGLPKIAECTKAYEKLGEFSQLLSRTTDDLFETIENENPFAATVRKKFLKELTALDNGLIRRGKR